MSQQAGNHAGYQANKISKDTREETNDNKSKQSSSIQPPAEATSSTKQPTSQARAVSNQPPPPAPPLPQPGRSMRPIRPNYYVPRQVMVAASERQLSAPIELASVLTRATAVGPHPAAVPPKRPTHLPARYEAAAAAATGAPGDQATGKTNRYAWAQVGQWQQAAAAGSATQTAAGHHGFHHHFSSPFSSAASRVLVVNPMQIVNLSEHTKSRLVKFIEALKRFSEQWFSHVLLLLFLAVYACFGAYIFISFEAPTEQWEKQQIIEFRQKILSEAWNKSKIATNEEEFLGVFKSKLEDYERLLNRACASGMTSSSLENQWTFWGALFYSMTVFTTIGYGHLTPITFAGRVATMVYAIFGIPILLMVLADLGKLLTRIIKYAFKKFRYLFNKILRRKSSLKTRKLISDIHTGQYMGVARNAVGRGLAYIQPTYNRSLAQFGATGGGSWRRANNKSHHRNQSPGSLVGELETMSMEQQPNGPLNDQTPVNQSEGNSSSKQTTSDVIVTPGKQTKPVSPVVDHSGFHFRGHHHSGHHGHHHHSSRAQSPGSSGHWRRKLSSGGATGSSRRPAGSQVAKGSLSRSSSSSLLSGQAAKAAKAGGDASAASAAKSAPDESGAVTLQVGEKLKSPGVQALQEPGEISHPDMIQPGNTADCPTGISGSAPPQGGATSNTENQFEQLEQQGQVPVEEETGSEVDDIEDEFDIPVSFALFLLVTYMMFGAVVFSIWEGWNFFDSLYFVFISMSTIGFGDLVPQHPKRMIGTFIYLLFGLALTSMCINVVQEKIHATFLRAKMQIGEKMGLDLEQIMADDYYDGSLVMECDEEDSNSVAVSQTNSSLAHGAEPLSPGGGVQGGDPSDGGAYETGINSPSSAAPVSPNNNETMGSQGVDGVKQSKSRDSFKFGTKKRSVTGLPGHANHHAGSLRRKQGKKINLSSPPLSLTAGLSPQPTVELSTPTPPIATPTPPVATPSSGSSCEVASKQIAQSEPPRPTSEQLVVEATASVNQPAKSEPSSEGRSVCELLRRNDQLDHHLKADDEQRKKVTGKENEKSENLAGRHHQNGPTWPQPPAGPAKNESGKTNNVINSTLKEAPGPWPVIRSLSSESARPSGAHGKQASTLLRHQVRHPSRSPTAPPEVAGRHSTRRASVSEELNQLDDLIVALSKSPAGSERFGPLLGIPSSARSSRSSSPSSSNQLAPISGRRGTSMTCRPTKSSPLSGVQGTKKSHGGGSLRSRPPDLSESQAALEELESIRFSAV